MATIVALLSIFLFHFAGDWTDHSGCASTTSLLLVGANSEMMSTIWIGPTKKMSHSGNRFRKFMLEGACYGIGQILRYGFNFGLVHVICTEDRVV